MFKWIDNKLRQHYYKQFTSQPEAVKFSATESPIRRFKAATTIYPEQRLAFQTDKKFRCAVFARMFSDIFEDCVTYTEEPFYVDNSRLWVEAEIDVVTPRGRYDLKDHI